MGDAFGLPPVPLAVGLSSGIWVLGMVVVVYTLLSSVVLVASALVIRDLCTSRIVRASAVVVCALASTLAHGSVIAFLLLLPILVSGVCITDGLPSGEILVMV